MNCVYTMTLDQLLNVTLIAADGHGTVFAFDLNQRPAHISDGGIEYELAKFHYSMRAIFLC